MALKPVDTAIKIIVGPLIDDTDFKSREESVAYNAAGMEIDVVVEKADGTIATTAVTPTTGGDYDWAHTDQGYYELELPASGGGTFNNTEEGILHVVGYATGVLPFRSPAYDVVPTMVYNSFVAGSDKLEVDAVAFSGDTAAADNAEADYDGTGYAKANSTIGTCTTNTDLVSAASIADAVWDETSGGHTSAGKAGEQLWTDIDAVLVDTGTTLDNHLTDIKGTNFVKDTHSLIDIETYVDLIDDGTSGLGKIASDVAAVLVDTGTTLPATLSTIEGYVDVIDDGTSGLVKIASDVAAVLVDTGTTLPATLSTIEGYVDVIDDGTSGLVKIASDVAAVLVDTGTTLPATLAGLNDISAADVNAQVVDVLKTDTITLAGQEAPTVTPTIEYAIGLLYKMARNKKVQDATTWELFNDAGDTVDQKATVSDDGTDFTKGEIASGP